MAEYIANDRQIVQPGETVNFITSIGCNRGLVRHREGTGAFLLSGRLPRNVYTRRCNCPCNQNDSALYFIDVGMNVAVPEDVDPAEISVAIAVDGDTIPATTMRITTGDVESFFNISRATNIPIYVGCCQTVTIRNTSTIPIAVRDANIVITRPDLNMTY